MQTDSNGTEGKWWEFWKWDWQKIVQGIGLALTAVAAIAVSIATFGAGVPLLMTIVAGVTLLAGVLTAVNAIATIGEGITGYNFVRDGVFQGNETAYNIFSGVTAIVAQVGTIILGVYQHTGQFQAAKEGRKYLGKGYKRQGRGRWVSKDGMRQLRWDKTLHKYEGIDVGYHFNLERFSVSYWEGGGNTLKRVAHIFYDIVRFWKVK